MQKDTTTSVCPRILHEEKAYFVVDKPPGWVSIPGRDPSTPSVLGWLREMDREVLVIHRIDRETSGLLLFARNAEFHREANSWSEKHQVQKRYSALASGRPHLPSFQVKTPIEGKRAVTIVQVVENYGDIAFRSEIQIATGKRHQIRIHLSGLGLPFLGDVAYGGPSSVHSFAVPRMMLHAAFLKLPTGEEYRSDAPDDFKNVTAKLRELGL